MNKKSEKFISKYLDTLKRVAIIVCLLIAASCDRAAPSGAKGEALQESAIDKLAHRAKESLAKQDDSDHDQREVLYFGVPPFEVEDDVQELRPRYREMVNWLERATGCRISLVILNELNEPAQVLAQGKVDFAILSPTMYVLAKDINSGINLLVTEMYWNFDKSKMTAGYMGHILVRDDRKDLNKLGDLKGASFGFVAKESTSGYQYPNTIIEGQGIAHKLFFKQTYFLGTHPRVTDAIYSGSVDAGATWDGNYKLAVKKHGDVFRSVKDFGPIPNGCVVAHPKLNPRLQEKIQKALLNTKAGQFEKLSVVGYAYRDDRFYDIVRRVMHKNKQLEKTEGK